MPGGGTPKPITTGPGRIGAGSISSLESRRRSKTSPGRKRSSIASSGCTRTKAGGGSPPCSTCSSTGRTISGDYVLFYPGLNSNLEILSTSYMRGSVSKVQAYRIISSSYPELAKASLSVIPEEANVAFVGTPNSSANVIAQIHNLPEKEVAKGYLKNFSAVEGTVDVSYSAKEIAAKAAFWLTEQNGIRFLNYSLLPDVIRTVKNPDGFRTAHLVFHLRVADAAGRTIIQREKEIRLKLDEAKMRAMEERKFVFNDLVPIIEGDFDVSLTLTNKTTEEFAVLKERIRTGPGVRAGRRGLRGQGERKRGPSFP